MPYSVIWSELRTVRKGQGLGVQLPQLRGTTG